MLTAWLRGIRQSTFPLQSAWARQMEFHARPFEPSIKSHFWKISSTFDDKCPRNGSKNDTMAPRTTLGYPHEGPSVGTWLQDREPCALPCPRVRSLVPTSTKTPLYLVLGRVDLDSYPGRIYIGASTCDEYSVGPSILPVCTRYCFDEDSAGPSIRPVCTRY